MTTLEKQLHSYFPVNRVELTKINSYFKPMSLRKGEYFSKRGRFASKFGYLESGMLREFANAKNGKEVTNWVSMNGFFVDLSSFLYDLPSQWDIQAVSDCEIFYIDKSDYTAIRRLIPSWDEIEKNFVATSIKVLENRIMTFLSMSAEERYHHFIELNPELASQIPLRYLASMLAMSPETLSRMRRKLIAQTT